MRTQPKCLKLILLSGAATISAQPASGQTILDILNILDVLDTTVTLLGADVANLNLDLAAQQGLLASANVSILSNTNNIANIQLDLGALDAQVQLNTGDIANIQAGLTANNLLDTVQDGAIAGLTAGLAANTALDVLRDGSIAALDVGLQANILRDDGQDGLISGLGTGLAANTALDVLRDGSIAALDVGLQANILRDDGQDGAIAGLGVDLAGAIAQNGLQDTAIAGLGAGLAANILRDDGQDTAIGALNVGLAANNVRDDGQDTAIGTLNTGLAANIVRDDGQDAAIGTLNTGLAANNVRDDGQDARLTYNEATLAQHDTRITEARQIGVTALADTAALRSDVEEGRVGLVRTAADGNIAMGAAMGGSAVYFTGTAGDRRLSGVANGIAPNDAATVGQLQNSAAMTLAAAQDYTDSRITGINSSFLARMAENNHELRTEINAAAASTAALAGLPQAIVPGKGMFAMGVGGKGDQAAIAFGVGKAFNHPATPILRAGAAVNTGNGDITYNAAVGIHF